MRLPFSLFVSLRYLRGRHRHRFISIVNFISIFGIAIGVMALIVVLSVMGGFDQDLKERVLGVYAPITIGGEGTLGDYRRILEVLDGIPEVRGASPFVTGQILARVKNRVYAVVVRAVFSKEEERTTRIAEYLSRGSLNFGPAPDRSGIVIGSELARLFGLKMGSRLDLLSPVAVPTPLGLSSHTVSFTVTGIFDSGMYEYDLNLVYVSLEAGQELYGLGKSVTGVSVKIDDFDDAFRIKSEIQDRLGTGVLVRTWLEMNRNLFRAVLTEKWMMFWILLLIVLVAAFNITSSLIMMVMEKTKDIGILKAIGTTRGRILRIFLAQGLMIGAVGTALGYVGGIALTLNLNPIADAVARWTDFEFFPKDIYYLDQIPTLLDLRQAALVALTALTLSVLAALYPAFQAARMNPVEAIRYE